MWHPIANDAGRCNKAAGNAETVENGAERDEAAVILSLDETGGNCDHYQHFEQSLVSFARYRIPAFWGYACVARGALTQKMKREQIP